MPAFDTPMPNVVYMVADKEIVLEGDGNMASRALRKLLKHHGKKAQKKYGHLVHPTSGERPTIVVQVPDPKKAILQIRLKTDSEEMRNWMKTQGLPVVGEIVGEAAAA